MKTPLRTKMALLILLAGLAFSCKKNENVPAENYDNKADTSAAAVDTIGAPGDTINSSRNGTTGATGEGSTGSGAEGTNQKGNTSIRTDSTSSVKSTKGK